ncbi:MAG: hypothetical protein COS99_06980 [Candidatus Omnitrophica bacterium CG07_land_8_20_14_0_80_42_15]|uniref:Methyltransferase type 11 domain-containing protein n=1 Tax=Candidatus Aquitaenariimonas noxiae TaxID=1974741 RepID=A0A2J0KUQ8_9BACT|nr:MAG: hypothetical protein COS99_06980 [Candidatus Omnitrophica bacterium CG07_land_8_20_14_0_80_42_15]
MSKEMGNNTKKITRAKDPASEIKLNNKWYIDGHFCQLEDRASAGVILKRWRNFENALNLWLIDDKTNHNNQRINILDAGCGDGVNLIFFDSFIKRSSLDAVLFGTDYNLLRLKRAKDKFAGVRFVNSLIKDSPFPDKYFDIVLLNHVLEHIPDDEEALNELSRIIKTAGLLLLCVPNEGCMMANIRNKFLQRSILTTTDHVNFYNELILKEKVKKSNFEVLFLFKEGFFFPHLRISRFFNLVYGGNFIINILHFLFPSQSTELFFVLQKRSIKHYDK